MRPLTNVASACLFSLTLVAVFFAVCLWELQHAHANQSALAAPDSRPCIRPVESTRSSAEIADYIQYDTHRVD
jgi:hypothetical protein